MATKDTTQPLTGKALLKKIKGLQELSRKEKAKACGYVSEDSERVQIARFLNAVLAAKGIELDGDEPVDGRGKTASYRVGVHQTGNIVIGAAYTKMMKAEPGDEFEIKLGYKHIHLKAIDKEN